LNITGLVRGRLAKSLADVGWGRFLTLLSDKAAEAGREIVQVNPQGTSQRCICGAPVPKTWGERWHYCPTCQLSVPRDQAAAMEILRLGLSRREQTRLSGVCVSREAVLRDRVVTERRMPFGRERVTERSVRFPRSRKSLLLE
jgi:putative transposase